MEISGNLYNRLLEGIGDGISAALTRKPLTDISGADSLDVLPPEDSSSFAKHSRVWYDIQKLVSDTKLDPNTISDGHSDDVDLLCSLYGMRNDPGTVRDLSDHGLTADDVAYAMRSVIARLVHDINDTHVLTDTQDYFIERWLNTVDSKEHPLYACYRFSDEVSLRSFMTVMSARSNYTDEEYNDIISEDEVIDMTNLNWIDVLNIEDMDHLFGVDCDREGTDGNFVDIEYAQRCFDGDISLWDVRNVRSMRHMFAYSSFCGDISKWDVSNVEDMTGMFRSSWFNEDISGWRLSGKCMTKDMFEEGICDERNRPSMGNVSESCRTNALTRKPVSVEGTMDVHVPEDSSSFSKHDRDWHHLNRILSGTDFRTCISAQIPSFEDVSLLTKVVSGECSEDMKELMRMLEPDELENLRNFLTVQEFGDWLWDMVGIEMTEVPESFRKVISALQTVNTKEHPLYAAYPMLTGNDSDALRIHIDSYIKLPVGKDGNNLHANLNWMDVSKVTDMLQLFCNCEKSAWYDETRGTSSEPIIHIIDDDSNLHNFDGDISLWDVSNVEDMDSMFFGCTFNGDISGWDVSKVMNMTEMFAYSGFFRDISGWQVSEACDTEGMFDGIEFPDRMKPLTCRK